MNWNDKQEVFDHIIARMHDNKMLWNIASHVALHMDLDSRFTNTGRKKVRKGENGLGLDLDINSTDEELRAGAKLVLIERIKDKSIHASDLKEFNTLFDLHSKQDELELLSTAYENAVIECPACGANVLEYQQEDLEPSEDPESPVDTEKGGE